MVLNYSNTVLSCPDLYPMMLPRSDELEGSAYSAFRLTILIEESGCPSNWLEALNRKMKEDSQQFEDFYGQFFEVLLRRTLDTTITG